MSEVKISYHGGHSGQFCDHADKCTLEQVVNTYIEKGYKHFGVSEHQPCPEGFLYDDQIQAGLDTEKIFERFSQYVSEAKRLQSTCPKDVQMLVGFETERCNDEAYSLIETLRAQYKVDYIVGSVHHVEGIPFDTSRDYFSKAVVELGSLDKVYRAYYEHQFELIQSCKPEVIGHFDLVRIYTENEKVSSRIVEIQERNIQAVVDYGGVFEVNSRALRKGLSDVYPKTEVLRMIKEAGGQITLGDDSHGHTQIGEFAERVCEQLSKDFSNLIAFNKTQSGLEKIEYPLLG